MDTTTTIILIVSVAFIILSIFKLEFGYYIMIFTLPFVYRPLVSGEFSYVMGFNSFFIVALSMVVFFHRISRKATEISKPIKTSNFLILILIVYGALVYFIKDHRFNNFIFEYSQDAYESFVNFTLFLVILILFNYIMDFIKDDEKLIRRLMLIFIFTSILHFLNDIFFITGINIGLPSALVFGEATLFDIRLAGLLSDYELMVDYSLIVIAFAFVYLIDTGRKYIITFIVIAIVLSLLSGTRSFLVTLSVFLIIYIILNLIFVKDKSYNLRIFLFSFGGIALLILGSTYFFEFSVIFERFSDSLELIKYKEYEGAANRSYFDALPRIINHAGYMGNGSLNVVSIEKDPMVFHSLYLSIYNNYGVFGLMILVVTIIIILGQMIKILRESTNMDTIKKAVVYIAIVVALLSQQYKITMTRDITFLLLYAFLVWNMYFLYRKFCKEELEIGNG